MRRSNRKGALQYVPELTWILFLRILDEREQREADEAETLGDKFAPSIESPYRWRDWAAPYDGSMLNLDADGKPQGWKRDELKKGELNKVLRFVNEELLPYLKTLKDRPNAAPRQKVVSEIVSVVERTRVDTDANFLDVLDKVHLISEDTTDTTHVFLISQIFEGLLLKMGEKNNDGGQFFTPREVIRAMVKVVDPRVGETVYDPACGTGGFLAEAYKLMIENAATLEREKLKNHTFYGREQDDTAFPIALANLVLHGIDSPGLWHGNTLTNHVEFDGLFLDAPPQYDVILMNPPFGGKEGKDAQKNFDYQTGATQVLFVQHALKNLKDGGRCGIVLDEGFSFRTNEDAFVKTKTKLLDECNLYCIISLPGGVFTAAGAGVKTNLLFFTKGEPTEKIWYYDLSGLKMGKKSPLTIDKFDEFFKLLTERADSDFSWTINIAERRRQAETNARPFDERAKELTKQVQELRQQSAELRQLKGTEHLAKLDELNARGTELATQAREQLAKAKAIRDAAFDLKAVNPNVKAVEDVSTPEELLDIIAAKGREVEAALAWLR